MKRRTLLVTLLMVIATAAYAGLHTRSGTVYVQNGQYVDAVRELKLAIEEDAKDGKAHFMIGVAYSNLDSVGLAYTHFTKAKELDPKKANDCDNNIQSNYAKHYQQGQKFFQQQNMTGAAIEFNLATQASPLQSSAHYNLAVAYSRLAAADTTGLTYQKALDSADKVLELSDPKDPNYMRALQLAANQLVYLGKPDEAKARLQKTIDEDPTQYPMVEEMGMDMMNKQKWAGAASFLKLAAEGRTKAGAEDAEILKNIGICEFNIGKTDPAHFDEAITYYEQALVIKGDDADTTFNLMAAYMKKEDYSNASIWGEKYVSLQPSEPKGWQLLARCYGELGEDDKAAEALARYQTLKSGGGGQ